LDFDVCGVCVLIAMAASLVEGPVSGLETTMPRKASPGVFNSVEGMLSEWHIRRPFV
jgi:hypothetical protein